MNLIKTSFLLFFSFFSILIFSQIPPAKTQYHESYPVPPSPEKELGIELIYNSDKTKKGFKTTNKTILEPIYDELKVLHNYPNKFILAKKDNKFGVFDIKGEKLIPLDYHEIESKDRNIFFAKKDKSISIFDLEKKKILISGNFKNIIAYNINTAIVEDFSNNQLIIFEDGQKIKNTFSSIDIYNNVIVVQKNNKFGILNSKKEPLFDFDKISSSNEKGSKSGSVTKFYNNVKDFVAIKNNLYGIIDINGKTTLPFEYSKISFDSRLYAFKLEKDKNQGIYFDENKILKAEYNSLYRDGSSDYLTLGKDGKYGVINYNTLKEIIPIISEQSLIRYHGGYKVKQNRKYGWYDKDGNMILPAIYDEINDFYNSDFLIGIQKEDKKGIYNIQKKQIIVPAEFDEITDYYPGFIVGVNENKKANEIISREFTIMDMSGKKILPEKFSSIEKSALKNSKIIFAGTNGNYKIISSAGKIITTDFSDYNYIYDEFLLVNPHPQNEHAILMLKNVQNKFALFDEREEKLKSDFIYDNIKQKFELETSYIIASKNKKYGIINHDDQVILDFIYDDLSFNLMDGYNKKPLLAIAKKNGKYGVVDFGGKTIIPFNYTNIERVSSNNLFKAKTGKNYVLIDINNNIMNNGPFDDIANFEEDKTLTFFLGKMKEIDKTGKFTKNEGNFGIHNGFKNFDELKTAFLQAITSNKDEDLKDFAKKIAPSPHLLFYLKNNIFTKRAIYEDSESIVNLYYNELLEYKKSYKNLEYIKKELTQVKDFTGHMEFSISSYRNGVQNYGDNTAEKYLRDSFKINGFWISSRFMKNAY